MPKADANALEDRGGHLLLRVRVQPKASRDAILVAEDGRIRVALTAPPVEGAANKALCAFVAKQLGLTKRCVAIAAGEKSREKTLRLEEIGLREARNRLGVGP
jgi:uncharacterized protein (TIGR00251 family)